MSTTPIEYYGLGKRKTSVARVHLRPGAGEIQLNDRPLDEYFGGHEALKMMVRQPFAVTETTEKFDVVAVLDGGGVSSQAGALRHGISRALCEFNVELPSMWALSPDGAHLLYLSYEPGTAGHPADQRVELRMLPGVVARGARMMPVPEVLVTLDGGQGTVNVSPWAPSSTWFAYCDYPEA